MQNEIRQKGWGPDSKKRLDRGVEKEQKSRKSDQEVKSG